MNPDTPNKDGDEDFDFEARRRRRREELGESVPESTPKPDSPAPAKPKTTRASKAKPPTKRQSTAKRKPAAKPPPSTPAAPGQPAQPKPLRPFGSFGELTPLDEPDTRPSRVDRSRLPTGTPPPRAGRQARPPSPPGPGARPSSILISLGAICIALFVVLQIVHGSGTSTTPSAGPTPTPTNTTPGPTTPATSTGTTPTPPPAATVRWSHVVTLPLNTPYTFTTYPPTQTQSFGHGLEVDRTGSTATLVADGNGDTVAQWTGHRAPTAAQCQSTSGTDRVVLGSGVPVGGWICAHSGSDDLRLRYLSGQSGLVSSSYRFLATVWNGGGG